MSYDQAAADYDALFTRRVDRWEDQYLARQLRPLVDGLNVLDLGCGTGWLLDHCHPGTYTGADASVPMLAELERKHPAACTVKAEVGAAGWVSALPDLPAQYDTITATWSLEYLGHPDRLLAALADLTVPGGRLALHGSTPRGHRREHFSVKSVPYLPISPALITTASDLAGLPRPALTGTSWLPDSWCALGHRAWEVTLAAPAGTHYAALWTWQL